MEPITQLLAAARDGDPVATERLFSEVYSELKIIAGSQRRRWRGNHTLNTTALIHEVFLKFSGNEQQEFSNRVHFYATASKAMRQILVNYAQRQSAAKRGGEDVRVELEDHHFATTSTAEEVLALHSLMVQLEAENPRHCRIVECRVFGGMSVPETAEALDISPATVKRDWKTVSARLFRQLQKEMDDQSRNPPG